MKKYEEIGGIFGFFKSFNFLYISPLMFSSFFSSGSSAASSSSSSSSLSNTVESNINEIKNAAKNVAASASTAATNAVQTAANSATSKAIISKVSSVAPPSLVPKNYISYIGGGNDKSNKYGIIKEIGKGGFSTVYLACKVTSDAIPFTIPLIDEDVAIKIVNLDNLAGKKREKQISALELEITILNKIKKDIKDNRNLLQMIEVIREPKRVGIVMECLSGGELFDRIVEKKHFSEVDAAGLLNEISRALLALHEAGIIHRDLKPENLMYTRKGDSGIIKITDFGLAKFINEDDPNPDIVGTIGYLAPEVITKRYYTPACDVWALGVILYILLVGYPPFYGQNDMQTISQIKKGSFVFHEDSWHDVSDEAKTLVRAMLTVKPESRITLKGVIDHPWITKAAPSRHLGDTIEKLKKFNSARKLKGVAKAIILGTRMFASQRLKNLVDNDQANVFTIDQLKKIHSAFGEVAGQVKHVDTQQFQAVLTKLGFGSLPIDRMFQMFDIDGNGSISYREFLVSLSTLREDGEESLHFCFDIIDSDGNGSISRDELYTVLKGALAAKDGGEVEDDNFAEKFETIMSKLDQDGDGKITFEEFKKCIEEDEDKTLYNLLLAPVRKI